MNLYELRRIDPAECDGVLLGNGAEQEEGIKPGYRYDYPVELLLLIRNERDFDRVYNTLLVEAYQYRPTDSKHCHTGIFQPVHRLFSEQ